MNKLKTSNIRGISQFSLWLKLDKFVTQIHNMMRGSDTIFISKKYLLKGRHNEIKEAELKAMLKEENSNATTISSSTRCTSSKDSQMGCT